METQIKQFITCLEQANKTKMLDLFSESALVHLPIHGIRKPQAVFDKLFSHYTGTPISVQDIFLNEKEKRGAVHFEFDWAFSDDKAAIHFKVVDLFQFDAHQKITRLDIIYDTFQVREKLEAISTN